jgi:hypothetical protein
VRRVLLWSTLLSLVLIGTGVVDWIHRLSHACPSSTTCCAHANDCHDEASACASGPADEASCDAEGHFHADHSPCGDAADGEDSHDGHGCGSRCSSEVDAHAVAHAVSHATSPGGGQPDAHDDHSCPICLTLASLAAVASVLVDDSTPIARLVGVTLVAADIAPSPTPLAAVEARPPPSTTLVA